MPEIKPNLCRTVLFTPANRPDRYEKAGTMSAADGVVLDLEDAVPLPDKDQARADLVNYLSNHQGIVSDHPIMTAIRINAISTHAGIKDLTALIDADIMPQALFLPKVQNAHEIELYYSLLSTNQPCTTPFIAAIETAYGMEFAHEIAAHPQVVAIAFGGGDLAADLGVTLNFSSTIAYRSRIVQAARYAGKAAWDVPYLDFKDESGLRKETQEIKDLGFTTKIAIHPAQLQPIVDILSPSQAEIDEAKAIVDTYKKAGGSACEYRGKMLDIPVVKKCEAMLDRVKLLGGGD